MIVNENDIETYKRDGVVCLRDAFDSQCISMLADWTEIAMASPGPDAEDYTRAGGPGRAFNDLDLARRHRGFREFIEQSPAAGICGQIMHSKKINFFYDQLIVKEPGTKERTPWHQDQPYWLVSGQQVCSLWLPLDPVSKEVCVQYVSGSHNWGAHNPHHFKDNSPYKGTGLPELADIEANRNDYDILAWDMQPGDCLVFQGMTVHGAPGNASSSNRRRALATRWTGDDARYAMRDGEVGIPTRNPGLANGAIMDCKDFPVLWRADEGMTAIDSKQNDESGDKYVH